MDARKIAIAAAGGALGLVAVTPAVAAFASTAPPGSSSSSALTLSAGGQPIAAVSPSSGQDSSGSSSSGSAVLEVGGQSVLPNSSETSSDGNGGQTSVVDTGANPDGRVQVAPSSATSSPSGSGESSEGQAAVARANVGGSSGVTVNVAQSDSKASYTTNPDGSTSSTGDSSTDGATVNAGGSSGLNLDVLHSEAHQGGSGTSTSYLLGANGNNIGTASDVGPICSSLSNPALALACVTASGGNGATGVPAAASVLTGLLGGTSGVSLGAFGASAKGTPGPAGAAAAGRFLKADGTWALPPMVIGFVMNTGATGTGVGPDMIAPRAASINSCVLAVKASDSSVALTFTIRKNGTARTAWMSCNASLVLSASVGSSCRSDTCTGSRCSPARPR